MKFLIPLTGIALLFSVPTAWANAFLDHTEPAVGSTADSPVTEIKIWFTQNLEPALSQMQLLDRHNRPVTQNQATVDSSDPSLLTLSVPALRPGKYKVYWKVMSVDTHMTVGNFFFSVRKSR
ncbi:MAG: copper resistance protein CopC [Verrucomicrobia bacterium]|nr:copper resistance protein CopC [Verrucomicrobiota bacterium]